MKSLKKRKKWLSWRALLNCLFVSAAVLIIATIFEFTQKVYLTDADKWHIDMINNDLSTTSTISGDIWVRHTVTGYNEVTEHRTVFLLMTYGIFTSIVGVAVIAVGLVVKSTLPKSPSNS